MAFRSPVLAFCLIAVLPVSVSANEPTAASIFAHAGTATADEWWLQFTSGAATADDHIEVQAKTASLPWDSSFTGETYWYKSSSFVKTTSVVAAGTAVTDYTSKKFTFGSSAVSPANTDANCFMKITGLKGSGYANAATDLKINAAGGVSVTPTSPKYCTITSLSTGVTDGVDTRVNFTGSCDTELAATDVVRFRILKDVSSLFNTTSQKFYYKTSAISATAAELRAGTAGTATTNTHTVDGVIDSDNVFWNFKVAPGATVASGTAMYFSYLQTKETSGTATALTTAAQVFMSAELANGNYKAISKGAFHATAPDDGDSSSGAQFAAASPIFALLLATLL